MTSNGNGGTFTIISVAKEGDIRARDKKKAKIHLF